MNILQYESKIWATADLLRGSGIKESEWPSFMMPFFALAMIESRLIRMFEELKIEVGEEAFDQIQKEDLYDLIKDNGQGYNSYIFEKNLSLQGICKNDKSFETDLDGYLKGFDGETKDLLGVDAGDGEKFLDIRGVITKLKAKKVLLGYTKLWAEIDLKPFNNSEITTLEEHIKRKWADISAETAGEQYTPDDVIALISEIAASKIEESDKLLKIYDCTCGGGNMLFGVEDRINQKFKRLTQTYGQDWNDALYALAKIESRFRPDSKIEHGNTLVDDKFDNEEFDVVIANPPYGVSWSGYSKDIQNDKTGRFKYLPTVADGQLLFMQHLISKLDSNGIAVVVHNGSTLTSGNAGSPESNIRKLMLDQDIVEAVVQLPQNEFFNTGINTYLWILNKNKEENKKDHILLINADNKYKQLFKAKGDKKREIDKSSRSEIIEVLNDYRNSSFSKILHKDKFCFNSQSIMLTEVDANGLYLEGNIDSKGAKSFSLSSQNLNIQTNEITEYDDNYSSLKEFFEKKIKPGLSNLNFNDGTVILKIDGINYSYDQVRRSVAKDYQGSTSYIGNGYLYTKAEFKKETKKKPERIIITVIIRPLQTKDQEIIPYIRDEKINKVNIESFMRKYILKPFEYLENIVGVEINFNKVFYTPVKANDSCNLVEKLKTLESEITSSDKNLFDLVTGSNSDVELIDTNIPWLDKAPRTWKTIRAKDLFYKVSRLPHKGDEIITAFRDGQVTLRKNRRTVGFTNAEKEHGYQRIIPGDLIIHAMDGFAGAIGVSDSTGKSSPVYSVYRPLDDTVVYTPYFGVLCREMALRGYISSLGKGIRERSTEFRNKEFLRQLLVLPPFQEQVEIINKIKSKTIDIDRSIHNFEEAIKLLKELRTATIAEFVSGQGNKGPGNE